MAPEPDHAPGSAEEIALAATDMRAETCPQCGADEALVTSDTYALAGAGVFRVGTLAVCLACRWSPYT